MGTAVASDTKGRMSGTIVGPDTKPIVGATVTVQSASDSETTITDAKGHYVFVSLMPDFYSVTVHSEGFRDEKRSEIFVQADLVKDESIALTDPLKEIGHITARSRSSLVQPGTTADVYSVNTAQQNAAQALGGGNQRDSIISSVASVPGVFVPVGQPGGWGQSVFIRGGDYTQTGYEYDGVPLNRAFDQYQMTPLSSDGTQEIQVYTGDAPTDQQTTGIGGYINQIVKSGSYPHTITADVGIGGPAYYNKAELEFSGANGPDQKFTYYIDVSGYGYTQRIFDQYNGSSLASAYGPIAGYTPANCGSNNTTGSCYNNGNASSYIGALPVQPNGYQTLPSFWGLEPGGRDSEVVGNFHFKIPHHRDNQNDDLQFLYANSQYSTTPNASVADLGPTYSQAYAPYYPDQNLYTGGLNGPLTNGQLGQIGNVAFPGHQDVNLNDPLTQSQSDSQLNEFSLEKLEYRHNIGTDANMRLTLYNDTSSEWQNGVVGLFLPYTYGAEVTDYQMSTQTTGIDAAFTKQLNAENLLNFDMSESTSKSSRLNNEAVAFGGSSPIAMLVNANNPTAGCYGVTGGSPVLTDCASADAASYVLPSVAPLGSGYTLQPSPNNGSPTLAAAGSFTCGTGPCEYYTVSNGANAYTNSVTSRFSSISASDHLTPNEKLALDLGLRYDLFQYYPGNTDTPGNQLYANTYNQLNCINGTSIVTNPTPGGPCSAVGPGYTATNLTAASHALSYNELSPRFGAAYTLDPNNVLRFSYGRFVEPAPGAVEELSMAQPFYQSPQEYAIYGWNSPTTDVQPEVSYNTDISWEHQFKDNSTSMKITPFYRTTNNEFATIVIDPKTDFSAYVNGLNRQSSGVELALRHGDFKKNGFSMMLAYTFTHSMANFTQSPTGGTFVTVANQSIQTFNGFTSYCASNPSSNLCPHTPALAAAPCYYPGNAATPGAPAPSCPAGSIANPYWNVKPGALLNPNASYSAYNTPLASGQGGGSASNSVPNVASLILNYHHNRFTITPSFQYEAGARYGSPLAAQGVNPATCGNGLSTSAANDPRYSAGAPAGSSAAAAYDASSCQSLVSIPDPYTGSFDGIGEFVQPSIITFNLQMNYAASKNTTLEFSAVNLMYRCFGGSKVPWGAGNASCNYNQAAPYVGNVYNPGDDIQQIAEYPYTVNTQPIVQSNSAGPPLPLELYFDVKVKM